MAAKGSWFVMRIQYNSCEFEASGLRSRMYARFRFSNVALQHRYSTYLGSQIDTAQLQGESKTCLAALFDEVAPRLRNRCMNSGHSGQELHIC